MLFRALQQGKKPGPKKQKNRKVTNYPGPVQSSKNKKYIDMPPASNNKPPSASLPVSRELVRMIRTSSQLQGAGHALGEHLQVVDARQAKAVEFYLRACALRLDQGL